MKVDTVYCLIRFCWRLTKTERLMPSGAFSHQCRLHTSRHIITYVQDRVSACSVCQVVPLKLLPAIIHNQTFLKLTLLTSSNSSTSRCDFWFKNWTCRWGLLDVFIGTTADYVFESIPRASMSVLESVSSISCWGEASFWAEVFNCTVRTALGAVLYKNCQQLWPTLATKRPNRWIFLIYWPFASHSIIN